MLTLENGMIPSAKAFDAYWQPKPFCQRCEEDLCNDDIDLAAEHEDGLCSCCRSVQAELDLDEGWTVYLDSLKPHAVRTVEQIDKGLAGWKCLGGTMTFEQDSKGRRSVATAKDFRFLAPGHKVEAVFGLEGVTLQQSATVNPPEWSVSFPFETPVPVILAACVAAITTN